MKNVSATTFYLEQWGTYVRYNRSEYLGYPKRNVIDRMIKEGPGASQSTGSPDTPDHETEMTMVNRCVCLMPDRLRVAIYGKYVYQLSIRQASSRLKLNREKYRRNLKEAQQRVSGYLDAFKEVA